MTNTHVTLQAVPDVPFIQAGDDLLAIIIAALDGAGFSLLGGDILVISSKIISKAEGRMVNLKTVTPSAQAQNLAQQVYKDPRLVELILQHSTHISRSAPHVLIVRHQLGFTSANAGIDASNVGVDDPDVVLLLPKDPNASAQALQHGLADRYGVVVGVVISDTHGRPFRFGNLGTAIGSAAVPPLVDQRGEMDLFGRELQATVTPLADELAAAAGLISGQAAEGQPIVLVRGVAWESTQATADDLIRPYERDLYA